MVSSMNLTRDLSKEEYIFGGKNVSVTSTSSTLLGCIRIGNLNYGYGRVANICILQSGRFCTTLSELFRLITHIIREILKFVHQNIQRLVSFQGTFCRIRASWQHCYNCCCRTSYTFMNDVDIFSNCVTILDGRKCFL